MNSGKTWALVGGFVVIGGVVVWYMTRDTGGGSTTKTTTTNNNEPLDDPSTATQDTLGGFVGNLLSTLWANSRNNAETNDSGQIMCNGVAVPADPYSFDGFNKDLYSSPQVKLMQTYLGGLHSDIGVVITDSGGVDGIVGNGFKEAYNMARKGCYITGVANLVSNSGA